MQNIHSIIFSCLMLYNRQKKILTKFLNFLYKTPLNKYTTTDLINLETLSLQGMKEETRLEVRKTNRMLRCGQAALQSRVI